MEQQMLLNYVIKDKIANFNFEEYINIAGQFNT